MTYHCNTGTTVRYQKVIERTLEKVAFLKETLGFDYLVFGGVSGAKVGFPVSFLLEIPYAYVRKKCELVNSHGEPIEAQNCVFSMPKGRFLIVDDFMDTGKTVRRLRSSVRKELPRHECVGIFQFDRPNCPSITEINLSTAKVPHVVPVFK